MNEIKFKNGSCIMGVDLADDSKIIRCERANSFVYDDMITPKWYRRWLRYLIMKIGKGE